MKFVSEQINYLFTRKPVKSFFQNRIFVVARQRSESVVDQEDGLCSKSMAQPSLSKRVGDVLHGGSCFTNHLEDAQPMLLDRGKGALSKEANKHAGIYHRNIGR
jgi:hypothetical protein